MKSKRCIRQKKTSKRLLQSMVNKKQQVQQKHWLNNIPYVVLHHISSLLIGFDALAYGACVSMEVMSSERQFWRQLGINKLEKQTVYFSRPRADGYYSLSVDYVIQLSSGRRYSRFIYNGFLAERLMETMNCCNSNSFRTFVRLHSYSSYRSCYNMPLFSFFDYSFMYKYRTLSSIEMKLFRICRNGHLEETPIIVPNIKDFIINLNNRFSFSYIKKWINFSLFIMAGGAVLNCLLIDGFDSSLQDLDFFWLGGPWTLFIQAINRFERLAHSRILKRKHINGVLIEFTLHIEEDRKLRIQFIFGRKRSNISFILYTFDLDIVQVAFNGSKIISTLGFYQAIATRSFICYRVTNDIRDAAHYVDRCFKYNWRGFTWLCPILFDVGLAQKPLISIKKMQDYGFQDFYFNVESFDVQYSFLNCNGYI